MVSVVVMMLCFIMSIMMAMGIVSSESGDAQTIVNGTADSSSQRADGGNQTRIDLMTNPNFTFFNETAGLPSYWSDPLSNCKKYFSVQLNLQMDGMIMLAFRYLPQTIQKIRGHP